MFLVDTNVWLHALLGRERADEAEHFLAATDPAFLVVTDFAVYSVGILLTRLGEDDLLQDFLDDVAGDRGVSVARVPLPDLREMPALRARFGLDFDDAYQYLAAKAHGCTLVSFDSDFDRTDLVRKTPADASAPAGG